MYDLFNLEGNLSYLPEEVTVNSISNMVNSYKEYKIAEAREITNRTMYREQSKIAIAKIVEESNQIKNRSNHRKEATMEVISLLDNYLNSAHYNEELAGKLLDTIREGIYAI